ncbi:hypothetical protein LWI29_003247 [Acer saccharum]|uniref:F-box domain-containing protein n=1 Tax=Acer saccharum TaxID=4024 RepID=A0AA39SB86_ACESA|nr:hypothetical protein LWI29_003247 [Acer saccharum]
MESFPREIILVILSRLPVTSLLQSKLVCKAWNNLVKDPLLLCMHFSRATKSDPCLILHCDNQLYSLELSDHCKDDQRVKKIHMPVLPPVVGSCKGLLCLCDSSTKKSLYVYNPFSRDYIELPKSTELLHQYLVFRFGFNQTTNKYKVIQAVYGTTTRCSHHRHIELSSFQVEVQILTLGSPAWRNLGKLPNHRIYQGRPQMRNSGKFQSLIIMADLIICIWWISEVALLRINKHDGVSSVRDYPRHTIKAACDIFTAIQARMQSVAHDLVQDPLLVSMHFSGTTRNDPCLILHCDYPIQNQLYSLELSDLFKDDQRVNKIRVPVFPKFNVSSLVTLKSKTKLKPFNNFRLCTRSKHRINKHDGVSSARDYP